METVQRKHERRKQFGSVYDTNVCLHMFIEQRDKRANNDHEFAWLRKTTKPRKTSLFGKTGIYTSLYKRLKLKSHTNIHHSFSPTLSLQQPFHYLVFQLFVCARYSLTQAYRFLHIFLPVTPSFSFYFPVPALYSSTRATFLTCLVMT